MWGTSLIHSTCFKMHSVKKWIPTFLNANVFRFFQHIFVKPKRRSLKRLLTVSMVKFVECFRGQIEGKSEFWHVMHGWPHQKDRLKRANIKFSDCHSLDKSTGCRIADNRRTFDSLSMRAYLQTSYQYLSIALGCSLYTR